jgi:hypothetical protein
MTFPYADIQNRPEREKSQMLRPVGERGVYFRGPETEGSA